MKTSTDNSNTLVNSFNDEYCVDFILDKRIIKNHVEYYVKWTGFADEYNTWEPSENLYCEKLVEEFENKLAEKKMYSIDTMEKAQSKTGPFINHVNMVRLTKKKTNRVNKTNKLIASDLAVNCKNETISKLGKYVDTQITNLGKVSKKVIDVHNSKGPINKRKDVKKKKKISMKKNNVSGKKIVKKSRKNKIVWNEPEKIIGSLILNGCLMILLKWKNVEEPDLIPAKEINVKWPQLIIRFYEKHLSWPNRLNL